MNKNNFHLAGALLASLLSVQICNAAPFVRDASFQQVFEGTDYSGPGLDLEIQLSTMSSDGSVVAYYGGAGSTGDPRLFVHQFTDVAPQDRNKNYITLDSSIGSFNLNTGIVSNRDGTRMFFLADDENNPGYFHFCMLNAKTKTVTKLLTTSASTSIERPQAIATDGDGKWLYFNESDNGDKGDLWRLDTENPVGPQLVLIASTISHPSGGTGRFADEMAVSDDGKTIAFFIEGRDPLNGQPLVRSDKELWVSNIPDESSLPISSPILLTDDDNTGDFDNSKKYLNISGDGATIVYVGKNNALMVTKSPFVQDQQYQLESGYENNCNTPGITQDGNFILAGLTNEGGMIIHTDGHLRYKVDTNSAFSGLTFGCTHEGSYLSSNGKRVFFKGRSRLGALGKYVDAMYTGVLDNVPSDAVGSNLWPTRVPSIVDLDYPAPLAYGIDSSTDFPDFVVSMSATSDALSTPIDKADSTVLKVDGYPAKSNSYAPVWIWPNPTQQTNQWEYRGSRGFKWPNPDNNEYAPLDPVTARFHVKDMNGNLAYRDVILQAAEGGCSGTGLQTLEPEDLGSNKDVSCITDGGIQTVGGIVITRGMLLYLSGETVGLNTGFSVVDGELKVVVK
ncbi:hypothetical protein [Thiolapillus sp.]